MTDIRKVVLIPGLLAIVALAAYMATKLDAQAPVFGDFSSAAVAEVRDSQGQVVVRGQFSVIDEEDDDIERTATLFSVRNLEPSGVYTFVIDGRDIGTATTDATGRVELDVEVTNQPVSR